MRTLPTLLLTLFYAALSFSGHGGMHALVGNGDCHHHAAAASLPDHACGHTHRGHAHSQCHGHCGDPASDAAEDPGQEPQDHAPQPHDHNHCLICQWHAQGKASVDAPVSTSLDAPCLDALLVEESPKTENDSLCARSRGPPLA